jgi:hydrogenase maturation protein HypF
MKTAAPERTRLKLCIGGAVQGVGFRPFVFRLASELALAGRVNNSPQGVVIEVEGERGELEKFRFRLETEKPPRSFIHSLETSWLDPIGYDGFEIRASETGGDKTAFVLPDVATCPDCLREIFDPNNRRYLYPFTNCTHCGPRFSIIESLPYDRANTSMKEFTMCAECRAEYDDPRDRRFHAQPNACPECGPRLELWQPHRRVEVDADGTIRDPRARRLRHQALIAAADAIRAGRIVAVKGLGGFHLMTAAHDEAAVRRLRERKHREEKPFALMFPSLEAVSEVCSVSPLEARLLCSPEAPIVLLKRITDSASRNSRLPIANGQSAVGDGRLAIGDRRLAISPAVAPGNPNLGVLLPYTPLHHLLMSLLGFPIVATSGNLSDEPICTDEHEALERLGVVADLFLVHNRPIVRHVDDSIVRVMLDRELVLRRARGYAPLPIQVPVGLDVRRLQFQNPNQSEPPHVGSYKSVLAVGAHLKNSVALAVGPHVFLSQHIGDLETGPAHDAFRRVIADFRKLYAVEPDVIAADAHPDYLSTKTARELVAQASLPAGSGGIPAARSDAEQGCSADPQAGSLRYVSVQHHVAHVLSCMAENELEPPALGVSWDGTGYGYDGTIWGGEFFQMGGTDCDRIAHLRPFRLPGGDQAVRQPRRTALGLLYELWGDDVFARTDLAPIAAFTKSELAALKTMLRNGVNSPWTSSAGRLFDAVAGLLDLRQRSRFEGQAAMALEFALEGIETDEVYPLPIADCGLRNDDTGAGRENSAIRNPQSAILLDWSPMIETILRDIRDGVAAGEISARFHNTLAELIVAVAQSAGEERVVLSGGCFQNRYLTERSVRRLQAEGFRPYWHQRVPPNDGGIALGQIVAARCAEGEPELCV